MLDNPEEVDGSGVGEHRGEEDAEKSVGTKRKIKIPTMLLGTKKTRNCPEKQRIAAWRHKCPKAHL